MRQFSSLATFLALVFLLASCTGTRTKLKARDVFRQCRIEGVDSIRLDSVRLSPEVREALKASQGSLLPDPKVIRWVQDLAVGRIATPLGTAWIGGAAEVESSSPDTLWLVGGSADVRMGSWNSHVALDSNPVAIRPGSTHVPFRLPVVMDSNLVTLLHADTVFVRGEINVRASLRDDPVRISFQMSRVVSQQDRAALFSKARDELIRGAVDRWTESLSPSP